MFERMKDILLKRKKNEEEEEKVPDDAHPIGMATIVDLEENKDFFDD